MKSFFRELRERHVIKVAVAYLVAAWVLLQIADVIFPALGLPEWSITLVLVLLALGFPAALILSWVFDRTPEGLRRTGAQVPDPADAPTVSPPEPAVAAHEHSIAVLPFPDLSAEGDQEHFCDGLTEELLNVLTGIPGLRVASRTSCFAFKDKNADLATVADRLRVAHVLEGSVRKAGNRIRITAQLIQAATDSHLWSETYNRELDDIFAIQDDIARRILEALQLQLGGRDADRTTDDTQAWAYFLRGRGYAITKITQDHDRAISLFRRAVELDSNFVRAWIELAIISAHQAMFHGGGERSCSIAEEAAGKAIELAPERADSLMARGLSHLARKQYEDAEADLRSAIDLEPRKSDAWYFLGRSAHLQGRRADACRYFSTAAENNAEDWESPLLALQGYESAGDADEARRFARMGIDRTERYLEDYPDSPRAYYLGTSALLILGEADRARRWAERALDLSPDDNSTRYNLACFYAVIGDADRALDLLENSISSRAWIENDSELDSLRGHPRYRNIIESMPD